MDVLAVVEDQEGPFGGQIVAQGGDGPARCVVLEAERGEHRLHDELGVLDGRQLDEPDAIGILAGALSTGPQGELCLADTAGARERQQPGRGERPLELGQTLTAPHETCQFDWQVAGMQAGSSVRHGQRSLVVRGPGSKAGAPAATTGTWVLPVRAQ